MQIKAETVEQYVEQLPDDRKEAINNLRKVIKDNIPEGYVEEISYGVIGYVVPYSIYPKGYHCTPKVPLPLMTLASQKNHISLSHMGVYANKELLEWFTDEYPKHSKTKLDMGKGCIRFKKINEIPYQLIAELVSKMTCEEWVKLYEDTFLKKK